MFPEMWKDLIRFLSCCRTVKFRIPGLECLLDFVTVKQTRDFKTHQKRLVSSQVLKTILLLDPPATGPCLLLQEVGTRVGVSRGIEGDSSRS